MGSRIDKLQKSDGTLIANDKETVEVLNCFFKSVLTFEDASTVPDFPTKVDTLLSDIYFTESDIYNVLKSLNPKNSWFKQYASSTSKELCTKPDKTTFFVVCSVFE